MISEREANKMADSIYTYGGTTDVGYNREINEDAMDFVAKRLPDLT